MIYINQENRIISIPKTRNISGPLSVRLTNIISGVATLLNVIDISTNPYVYKIELSETQVRQLGYGEYIYEAFVNDMIVGHGLLRKPKKYDNDIAYSNIEPNIIYNENDESIVRHRVVISGSNCTIIVNGESYETFDRNVQEDTILVVTANPEQGYEFVTWSDGVEDQTRTIIVESDVNLYASVEAETYQVTITAGDHGTVSVNGIVGNYVQTVPYGTVLNVEAIPDTGYDFTQWSDGNTDTSRTITVTGPVSLTSAYATETYQVTITAGEHCSITVNGVPGNYSARVAYGTQLTLVATPDTGYDFTGWSDGDASSSRSLLIVEDTILTTATQIQSFMVNIMTSNNEEGLVVVNGVVGDFIQQVNYGTVLTLTTQPTTGYDFLMWSDGVIADQRTITVTYNVTLRATFAVQVMNVSITSPTGNGSFTINGQTYSSYITTVPYGTVLNVEAVPDSHYHFTQWSDGSSSTSKTLHVTSDVSLTGSFAINQYQVTLSAGANGSISVNGTPIVGTYSELLDYNTTLNVEAIPVQDYSFDTWSDGNTSNPRTITVTGSVTLSAAFEEVFVQNNKQIVYTSVSGQTITPSGDAYDANDNPLTIVSNDYSRGFGVITYSGDISKLGDRMYDSNTDLQTVTVPDGVKQIGEYCFHDCSNMTNVYFGENSTLEHILGYGFAGTALESIVLPDSFIDWYNWIFDGVTTLDYIYIPRLGKDMEWYSSDAFAGFNTHNGVLVTSIYNNGYYFRVACVGALVDNFGWTVKYIEQVVKYETTQWDTPISLNNYTALDANGNNLTATDTYDGNTGIIEFSGDPVYLDGIFNNETLVRSVIFNLDNLGELGGTMFNNTQKLEEIRIPNSTAPVVNQNTFKGTNVGGTLKYPATSDYSTWLSTSDYYLGYYNWNGIGGSNTIFIKTANSNLTVNDQYLKDSNDNQLTVVSTSHDGTWLKVNLSGNIAKISNGSSSDGWISPSDRSSVSLIVMSGLTYIGDYQMSGFSLEKWGSFNNDVTYIGNYAFANSTTSYFDGFSNVTFLGTGCFQGAQVPNLIVEGSFTQIKDNAFNLNACWNSLEIFSNSPITYIGNNTFGGSNGTISLKAIEASTITISQTALANNLTVSGTFNLPYHIFADLQTQLTTAGVTMGYFEYFEFTTNDGNGISDNTGVVWSVIYFDNNTSKGKCVTNARGSWSQFANNTNLESIDEYYGFINNSMFSGCSSLEAFKFNNVTAIGNEAFDETILKDIYIPATLTEIHERPFRCDYNTLVVDPNNTYWKDENSNALITKANDVPNTSWHYADTLVTIGKNDQIPSGVVNCAGWTFSGTNRTKAVNVPLSVQGFADCCWNENCSINGVVYDGNPSTWSGEIMKDVGLNHYVYMQYKSDCEQRWPDETWYARSVEDNTIYYTANTTTQVTPTTLSGWGANYVESVFDSSTKEGEIRFDGPITAIPDSAFLNDTNLAYVEIPSSTLTVGDHAFEGCSNLGEICTKAQTEPTVGASTFKNIKTGGKLTKPTGSSRNYSHIYVDINYTNNWLNYDTYKLGSYEWNGLRSNNNYDSSLQLYYIEYSIDSQSTYPDTRINTGKFYKKGTTAASYNRASNESTSICRANFNDNFLAIGIDAFSRALRVTNVTVGRNVYMVNAAFRSNTSITNATLYCPIVAQQTFLDCTSLTRVDLYSTVYLGSQVFGGCTSLSKIRFWTSTPPKVEATTFANVPQTGTIIVPTGSDYTSILYRLPSGWTVQYI